MGKVKLDLLIRKNGMSGDGEDGSRELRSEFAKTREVTVHRIHFALENDSVIRSVPGQSTNTRGGYSASTRSEKNFPHADNDQICSNGRKVICRFLCSV